jgi:RNA polymerase sigma-70 factor, ECF subfamily
MSESHQDPDDLDPADLAVRARAGDGAAFARLIRRYQGMVYKIVCQQVRGDVAEEVVWDAWYRVYANLAQLRDPRGTGGWIAQVARSAAIDWLRRQDARQRMEQEVMRRAVGAPGPEREYLQQDLHLALSRALDTLPEDDRWIVHLSYIAGRTSAEIGATMGMPQSTVKWRLLRSRERLRQELVPYG